MNGAVTLGAALFAVLASLVGPAVPAQAAEALPVAAGTPQAGPEAPATPTTSPTAEPSATAGPKAEAPKPDPKADHEAAVKSLQQSGPAGPCPTTIEPGTVVTCSIDSYKSATLALTLPQQKDLVLVQVIAAQGWAYTKLTAPDGTAVACENVNGSGYSSGLLRCATSQAGTYALEVRNNGSLTDPYSISYLPLLSAACKPVTATDLALGAPTAFHGSLATGAAGDCYVPEPAAGDTLRTHVSPWMVTHTVYDATGKELCTSRNNPSSGLDCRLNGTAPFRVLLHQSSGTAQTYDFTAARLSQPAGCPVAEPLAYGVSPDLTSTARCRTLRVTESARHSFVPVVPADSATSLYGRLFKSDGTELVAHCSQGACDLEPGDYTWALNADIVSAGAFGLAFHSAKETRGCTATGDAGLANGPATGTFGGPGQLLCLTLPTASGNGVFLLNRPPAEGVSVTTEVFDAAGAKQCVDGGTYLCPLTGTAPFRVVLKGTASKAYGLVVHRSGESAGCTAWPQSPFNGSWGAEVSLTTAVPHVCLSIPADQHAAVEMLDYTNSTNSLSAAIDLVDPQGNRQACGGIYGTTLKSCRLTPGVPYIGLLSGTSWQSAGTYKLVRRDTSATANCPVATPTAVGGPSTPFDLTSALDARCVRITGPATDKLWISARTVTTKTDTAALMVVDGDGKLVCYQWGISCQLTGATSYTATVIASGYTGKTIRADFDLWKVGTAAGWAPECTANPISVSGFAMRSGVLTESSTAYCAVVDIKPSQSFTVAGTTSSTTPENPQLTIHGATTWGTSDYTYQCGSSYGVFGARCQLGSSGAGGQALLLLSPARVATPVEYSMQGLCDSTCTGSQQALPSTISPVTGSAGTRVQAVVRGSKLTLGTKLQLRRSDGGGSERAVAPLSVSSDGTSLNVLVDTNGLEPGTYDVIVQGIGYTSGTPSPGYLPKAFTVTAAATPAKSRFVPVTPARFLDTRAGLGAPQARVGHDGVVTLQVAGVKGVPATGVTAVVMNVTAVNPDVAGHVTVYPDGQPVPNVSNLNFAAGRIVPNLVTVPVVNGKVDLRNSSWGGVDLLADVTGYYTDAATGSALTPITPARFLDTRSGQGAPQARVGHDGVVTLQVAGVKGVPATGVTAVVMNVTAVNPDVAGHVTVYPDGQPVPDVSNLNFTAGQIVPNLVTVPVVNGKVDLRNSSWGGVDLIADVTGYYAESGSTFSSAAPVRLLDTRDGTGARAGAVGTGGLVSVKVAGVEGVPLTGVSAVVLNVTVTAPTGSSHLTVHPHGIERPAVSNLNYASGQTVSNLVVVPVVDGRVSFTNSWGDAQVIADLNGWFTA